MNKAELIARVAEATGLVKTDVAKTIDATTGAIISGLVSGDSIGIVGFGTFKVAERAARVGRNPKTGESIQIKASKIPKFIAGKALKEAVN